MGDHRLIIAQSLLFSAVSSSSMIVRRTRLLLVDTRLYMIVLQSAVNEAAYEVLYKARMVTKTQLSLSGVIIAVC